MANTPLTKEYFEKSIAKLTTKEELKNIATKDDLKKLATKEELFSFKKDIKKDMNNLEVNLKDHVTNEIEKPARMTAKGFEDLEKRLDVREDVEKLKERMKRMEDAIQISVP